MTWNLDYVLGSTRVAALTELDSDKYGPRWDGIGSSGGLGTTPRLIQAGAWFTGGPGREREAAEAWAFEMKVYFKRGVEGQPQVSYANGTYTVIGLIQTTHPGDQPDAEGVTWFT
jgi:hypothetical protein